MKNWVVIRTGGKQYKDQEGDVLEVEKLGEEKDKSISFDEVLVAGGDKVLIGTPLIEKAKVQALVIDETKGKKIRVVKFKPKAKYLRTKGHRHQFTKVKIGTINL